MKTILVQIILCIHLIAPSIAAAQAQVTRDPLSYPIRTYGFMLGFAVFGGMVSFYAKIRKGEVEATSLTHFVGEIATAAFAGLVVFYICEYAKFDQILTAPIVGISGHMGAKIIALIEEEAKRRAKAKLEGGR